MKTYNSLLMYEEGLVDGIEVGQKKLFIKLLKKRFGSIPDSYLDKIDDLSVNDILNLSLNIFEYKDLTDLNKLL